MLVNLGYIIIGIAVIVVDAIYIWKILKALRARRARSHRFIEHMQRFEFDERFFRKPEIKIVEDPEDPFVNTIDDLND